MILKSIISAKPLNDQIRHNNSVSMLERSNEENKENVGDNAWCTKNWAVASFCTITSSSSSSAGYANSIESMAI